MKSTSRLPDRVTQRASARGWNHRPAIRLAFGAGDIWVLRRRDRGSFNTITSVNADAKIGASVNGEPVLGQDVVLWFGAHFNMTSRIKARPSIGMSLARTDRPMRPARR